MSLQAGRYPAPATLRDLARIVPCSHAGCPLGVDLPGIARALATGEHERAHALARTANPFASTCGHTCHAPCEHACRRHDGAPVATAALEAFAADLAPPGPVHLHGPVTSPFDTRWTAHLLASDDGDPLSHATPSRVAVVGGGAAGLSCAGTLARLGHRCVLFDDGMEPGGVLSRAIPSFRIPLASVRAECAAILSQGVELRRSAVRGPAAIRHLLATEFDAVFIATGAWRPHQPMLGVLTSRPAQLVDAVDLLAGHAAASGRIVVVGEGDLAADAARAAARSRSGGDPEEGVDLVLTASLDDTSLPAHTLAAVLRDGVRVHAGWQPRRVMLSDDPAGMVTAIELSRHDGLTSHVLRCDQLVLAGPRAAAIDDLQADLSTDGNGYVAVDPHTLQTSLHRVWAGGACAFGHRTIAHAVADGVRGAWQIHSAVAGVAVPATIAALWVEADDHDGARARAARTVRRRSLPLFDAPAPDPFSGARKANADAIAVDALRCFDCTVLPSVDADCTGCGECVAPCPARAISLGGNPRVARVDQDACTRCGICANRCPEAAITMVRAVWELRSPNHRPLDGGAQAHAVGCSPPLAITES